VLAKRSGSYLSPEHHKLAEDIRRWRGYQRLSSGTPPESNNFPPRNRINSGISRVVCSYVRQAKQARIDHLNVAAEHGRDGLPYPAVFTLNHPRGTNRLIQQGARPLLNVKDVLEALNIEQVTGISTGASGSSC
jgi:DNA processing protein